MITHPRIVRGAVLAAAVCFLSGAQALAAMPSPVLACNSFVRQLSSVCLRTPAAFPASVKTQFCTDGLGAGLARCASVFGKRMPPMMPKAATPKATMPKAAMKKH
jgi:hypothetical protein